MIYRTAATLGQNFAQYLFTSTFSDGQLETRIFERLKIWANPEFGTFRDFRWANLNCDINCKYITVWAVGQNLDFRYFFLGRAKNNYFLPKRRGRTVSCMVTG
jgi:hypothetical protein